MLLYLTSNQKSGLIDGAAREMLLPSKKLVGKFSLKSFVTKDMRNYATAKFFLIDAACIEESGEDFTLALRSCRDAAQKRRNGDGVQSGGVVDCQRCGGRLH